MLKKPGHKDLTQGQVSSPKPPHSVRVTMGSYNQTSSEAELSPVTEPSELSPAWSGDQAGLLPEGKEEGRVWGKRQRDV